MSDLSSRSIRIAAVAVVIGALVPAVAHAKPPRDFKAPTVSITEPGTGARLSGLAPVKAAASDNVGVSVVRLTVDGVLHSSDTTAPYEFSVDTAKLADGTHSLTAIAADAAGNTTTSTPVSVTVSNAPAPDITPPTAPTGVTATATSSDVVAVTWTEATDDRGVRDYRVYRDGLLVATLPSTARSHSDTGRSAATTYQYAVRAVDTSGNVGPASTTATVTTPAAPTPPAPAEAPDGANLPITYDLAGLKGTAYYVSTTGSDTAAGTSVSAPLRTLGAAVSKVASGTAATIVVRGGTYRDGTVTIGTNRAIRVLAYPNEVPVFRGDAPLTGTWTTDGTLQWHAYTPRPVTNGSGIDFINGQNLTGDGVGKHPDQVWIGDVQLRQVTSKTAVVAGTFWVDQAQSRVYLTSTDVAKGSIAASKTPVFMVINGAGTTLEGLRVMRFSNGAADYGVIRVQQTAHDTMLRNVEIVDPAFMSVMFTGSASSSVILRNPVVDHVTIDGPNWMGISSSLVDGLVVRNSRIVNADRWDEFTSSPQSGAIKTSRNRHSRILGNTISGNRSHAVWFDQSNVDVDIVGNDILDNTGNGVFFEISDDLLLADNRIRSTGSAAVKLAGSSGLKIVNNTVVGGGDVLGIYTDSRSKPGCADPSKPLCSGSYSSDRDTVRPYSTSLDWMPRIDLMLNNVVAHPTSTGLCGIRAAFCVTTTNATASQPLEAIFHQADANRGIPRTRLDGDVYVNGTSTIARLSGSSYTTVSGLAAALAASPITLSGMEAAGRHGTTWVDAGGNPTAALLAEAHTAIPIPTDTRINTYLPAGLKRHGAAPAQ